MSKPVESIIIAPSMLAADFTKLGDEARRAEMAGADRLHLDIMDGHFVPNLSFGPAVVAAINRSTELFLDVHLMMYNPFEYIEPFVAAGADLISFHLEATEDVEETITYIRRCGKQVGLAISPDTPVSLVVPFLSHIDQLLIMTVQPGFGGQSFREDSLERISEARSWIDQYYGTLKKVDRPVALQVDGGIDAETAAAAYKAGATSFVSGTTLFKSPDMKQAITEMRARISQT